MSDLPRIEARAADPVREAISLWIAVILGLAVLHGIALAIPFVHSLLGAVAVAAFLWTPLRFLERRGQDAHDAGWRFDRLGRDVVWALLVCAVVLPLFTLLFWQFPAWLTALPRSLRELLAPYAGPQIHISPRWTWQLGGHLLGNAAVAFAEEFFYRGYMTLRFEERWTPLRSALTASALFAVGHLLQPAPFRLLVFFPALIFAWLRHKTGTVVAAAIAHFAFNAWLVILIGS